MCKGVIDMNDKISEVIEQMRPFIQRDGGDVEFIEYDEGIVYVQLKGACVGCPSSYITLKSGIEHALKVELGEEIKGVEQIYLD